MNDTEILTTIQGAMRRRVISQAPVSPALIQSWIEWIEQERQLDRRTPIAPQAERDDWWTAYDNRIRELERRHSSEAKLDPVKDAYFQSFWKCKHHPSAIDNWKVRDKCEHGCEKTELRWYDNGCHSKPAI